MEYFEAYIKNWFYIHSIIYVLTFVSFIYLIIITLKKKLIMHFSLLIFTLISLVLPLLIFANGNPLYDNKFKGDTKDFYKKNQIQFEEIIDMIRTGQIQDTGVVLLPFKYRDLSYSCKILIEKEKGKIDVMFWKYRGIIDRYIGICYSSSIKNKKVKHQLSDNWYWKND